jgi:hypothetical protein
VLWRSGTKTEQESGNPAARDAARKTGPDTSSTMPHSGDLTATNRRNHDSWTAREFSTDANVIRSCLVYWSIQTWFDRALLMSFPQVKGLWKYAAGHYICSDYRNRALKLPKKP